MCDWCIQEWSDYVIVSTWSLPHPIYNAWVSSEQNAQGQVHRSHFGALALGHFAWCNGSEIMYIYYSISVFIESYALQMSVQFRFNIGNKNGKIICPYTSCYLGLAKIQPWCQPRTFPGLACPVPTNATVDEEQWFSCLLRYQKCQFSSQKVSVAILLSESKPLPAWNSLLYAKFSKVDWQQ